jgi:hypothetical protein
MISEEEQEAHARVVEDRRGVEAPARQSYRGRGKQ